MTGNYPWAQFNSTATPIGPALLTSTYIHTYIICRKEKLKMVGIGYGRRTKKPKFGKRNIGETYGGEGFKN